MNVWLWNHYATEMFKNRGGRHYWFAENLIRRDYVTTVFCANTFHNKEGLIDTGSRKYATESVNGVPFVFVKTATASGNGMARLKNMVLFYWNLFAASKGYANSNGRPDVIVASSVHPLTMVAGIQVAKRFKIPCICEIRDLWPEAIFSFGKLRERSLLGRILVSGEHWIYRNADALIFTKEGDIDYLKERSWDTEHGGDVDLSKCHYINNGLDLFAYLSSMEHNVVDDPDLNEGKFNVVYTGAIRPVNNVGNILDAASLLTNYDDIRFLIYGDGNQLETLQQRVVDEGLTNVKLKGFIEKKYIPFVLSRSSVNLLNYSSTRYNWSRGNSSNKLFEYMASGKPIISTVRMGYCLLQRYHCGLSLSESTPQELAETILTIRGMSKLEHDAMTRNMQLAVQHFDFGVLTTKLAGIIDDLCPRVTRRVEQNEHY